MIELSGDVGAMIAKMGFRARWRKVVMDCITTARFFFSLNRSVFGEVLPQRRLRQGCPLSPYLFLLYLEGFSFLLADAEFRGDILGFACTRRCPRISHRFFPDESVVFCRAKVEKCSTIRLILAKYEAILGQMINLDKSMLSFNPNVGEDMRTLLQHK